MQLYADCSLACFGHMICLFFVLFSLFKFNLSISSLISLIPIHLYRGMCLDLKIGSMELLSVEYTDWVG